MLIKYNEGYGWKEDIIPKEDLEQWASEMAEDNKEFRYYISLSKGDRVSHSDYGYGVVSCGFNEFKVYVKFDNHTNKDSFSGEFLVERHELKLINEGTCEV